VGEGAFQRRHRDLVRDQFTKQAVPFSTAPLIKDEEALELLVKMSGAGPNDTVLDVACGPGIVTCAFARVCRHAAGIDITPAMIDRALALQREKGLSNVEFQVGDVLPLPHASGSFSIVASRFAFHHFIDPKGVLLEMQRVCAGGGKVVLADVMASNDPLKAAAFDRMEKLRDPSHVHALTLAEQMELFIEAGLKSPKRAFYDLTCEVEGLLERSFPAPGDGEKIRGILASSLEDDSLGMRTRREGDEVLVTYPIAVLVGEKPQPTDTG
jgi:ubiquinone/menaquinone biosynthesis C-methylase UbiE